MSQIERTLEEERREKVARAISAQGWSCEMHEPDYDCSQCQPLLLATADAAIEASGLPLRNAQVEAVLSIHCPVEVEPSATICSGCSTRRGTFPDFRYFPVVEYPCETVRAIEEAGA